MTLIFSDETDDGAGGRGAAHERELRQLPAAVRGRAAEGAGQARQRAPRGAGGQAPGARGEHGGDQEHALLHVQIGLRASVQVGHAIYVVKLVIKTLSSVSQLMFVVKTNIICVESGYLLGRIVDSHHSAIVIKLAYY